MLLNSRRSLTGLRTDLGAKPQMLDQSIAVIVDNFLAVFFCKGAALRARQDVENQFRGTAKPGAKRRDDDGSVDKYRALYHQID